MKALLLSMLMVLSCFAIDYRVCSNVTSSITENGITTSSPSNSMHIGVAYGITQGALILYREDTIRIPHYRTFGEGEARLHEYKAQFDSFALIINHNGSAILVETEEAGILYTMSYACTVVDPEQ